jgi:uncharacterized membrane protein
MLENPLMLAGLGGAAVPFALHMLSRARYRPVTWGAMMFLEQSGKNDLLAHRVKRWSLLALRMLAVGLLAVALARPVVAQGPVVAPEDARVTAAIIVDCSASMLYDEGGRSRMDLARGVALKILSSLKRGDEAVLITSGSAAATRNRSTPLPSSDLQGVANRVSNLEAGAGGLGAANFAEALTTAMNLLDRVPRGRRQLFAVCDRQATSWNQVTENYLAAWRDRLAKSAALDRFAVFPVGGEGSSNVAVDSIGVALPPVVRGVEAQVEVRVRNYDDQPRVSVPVVVGTEKRELLNERVNLPARGSRLLSLPVTFDQAGSQIVFASVRGRGLGGDDRLESALAVVDPIRTLIVSEDQVKGATNSDDAICIQAALAPYRVTQKKSVDAADVKVVAMREFGTVDLKQYQVLVLANVAQLNAEQARRLERFVEAGGGLMIVAGNLAQPGAYNASLYRNGVGLLPAALGAPADEVGDAPVQVDALDHPIFRFLGGTIDGVSGSLNRRFLASPAASAVVLARTASGEPLVIEKSRSKGKVILVTTGLGNEWGTLPQTGFYVPFVQSAVRYLAAAAMDRRNLRAGEDIVLTLADAIEGKPNILLPDGGTAQPDVVVTDAGTEIRYSGTQQTGRYVVRARTAGGERQSVFVVQPGTEESDLTPLPPDRWERLGKALGFARVERAAEDVDRPKEAAGTELWLWLTVAVVGVLVAEMALSRFWYSSR